MGKLKVGIIFGGRSEEHEISLLSARSVAEAMDKARYHVVPIAITREGHWLPPQPSLHLLVSGQEAPLPQQEQDAQVPIAIPQGPSSPAPIDVVFPVLHGPYGEDGTLQGLLEMADLPYVGCGVLASALGMDKALHKTVLRQHGLPVPQFMVVLRKEWEARPDAVMDLVERQFTYPCFVKPANLGSSIGISKAHSRPELAHALEVAADLDRKLLVEEAIPAREIECSVLGNEDPVASVLGEIVPAREFYDYEAKYHDERTQLLIPTDLPADVAGEIQRLAVAAFRAIDGAGMARVDFFVRRGDSKVYVNEINTIPGFTAVSMYPKLWEASGIPYPQLIDRLIALALERYADRKRHP